MSLVIYTAIFGNYDALVPPKVINKNIKYVCFTDKKFKCYPWEIRVVKPEFKDPIRENRKYKILSHRYFKDFQYSIYIDGNIKIICDLNQYIEKLLDNNDIAVFEHPNRNCLYKEAIQCIKKKKDEKEIIKKQIKRYIREGYPKNNGLTINYFIVRRHTEQIEKFNEMWWNEVKNYSKRDQISFGFVIYKLRMNYSLIPNSKNLTSIYIEYISHKKKPKMINLDKTIRLIKSHFASKPLIIRLILKLEPYASLIPIINNMFIKKLYHQIKVPLILYYFIQHF